MQELVTVEQAERVLRTLAVALPLLGVAVGAAVGAARGRAGAEALRGLAVGLLGPLTLLLWWGYSYTVRYDPRTGRAGLHSVRTLLAAALGFIVVGALLGAFYRRCVFATPPEAAPEDVITAPEGDEQTPAQAPASADVQTRQGECDDG